MFKQILFFYLLIFSSFTIFSQEEEDEKKMIRDVISVDVSRAQYAPKPPVQTPPPVDPKSKKHKKHVEEVPVEPVQDTLPPMMPAPSQEILKRAQHWYTLKNKKFVKASGSNNGKSVACNLSFVFKQKLLNPENEVDGKITMDLIIDAKEGKYRYTIKNIKHVATKQGMSGGDIFATVAECGSMSLNDRTWKQIRTEALANAGKVVEDLKAVMKEEVKTEQEEW